MTEATRRGSHRETRPGARPAWFPIDMLSIDETDALLQTLLPLLRLPPSLGEASFALCVDDADDPLAGRDGKVLGAALESGVVRHAPEAVAVADAWLRGTASEWLAVLFGRGEDGLHLGGAPDLAAACLAQLQGICCTPKPSEHVFA